MSEAKFTKGDWSVSSVTVNGERVENSWSVSVGGFLLANVRSGATFGVVDEMQKANAYLIAAAPEMYKEIEDDIKNLKSLLMGIDPSSLESAAIEKKISRKKKLLAKARGE